MTVEQWRPIPGWEGLYEVSDTGRVRSLARTIMKKVSANGLIRPIRKPGRILSAHPDSHGYPSINLCRGGKSKTFTIHRLVLIAFIGPKPDGHECRHLDGNRSNNRLSNITWGTSKENADDQKRHGTDLGFRGANNGRAVLDDEKVRKIRARWDAGEPSPSIARDFGISRQNALMIGKRAIWRHVA